MTTGLGDLISTKGTATRRLASWLACLCKLGVEDRVAAWESRPVVVLPERLNEIACLFWRRVHLLPRALLIPAVRGLEAIPWLRRIQESRYDW